MEILEPSGFTTITNIMGLKIMIKTEDIRNIAYVCGGYRVVYDTPDSPLGYATMLIDMEEFTRLEVEMQSRMVYHKG